MADFWEDTSNANASKVQWMLPFWNDTLARVDGDSVPKGRGYLGDSLANWEEYRGFRVYRYLSADSDSTIQIRSDPNRKTVFVKLHPDVRQETSTNFPGFINSLNDDSGYIEVYRESEVANLSNRWTTVRTVDTNTKGGATYFPPFHVPVQDPIQSPLELDSRNFRANAVVYWNADNRRWIDSLVFDSLGHTYYLFGIAKWTSGFSPDTLNLGIPNLAYGISVYIGSMLKYRANSEYYNLNIAQWTTDFPRIVMFNISHEFGHTVGIMHADSVSEGFMFSPTVSKYTRFAFPPSIYGPRSVSQFTVIGGR